MPVRLHALDLGVVGLYLVAITLFGLRFSRRRAAGGAAKDRSLRGYFLANKTIPWWAISLSIVSAETSTLTIIGTPGLAFAGDFGFLQIVFGYMFGRVVVALLFLPKYFQGEMLTAYQLIDRRFGHTLHKVTAGLFLLTRAAAEGVRVFAVSIVVGIAIGTGDVLSIAIISALTLLYTFEGGMAAVIWTDVVQMAIYVGGTLVAIWSLGAHVPGGWATIHTIGAAAGKFHMLNFAMNLTTTYTFWAGVLGGTFLTMASHGTDQLMVQRMLAAKNLTESRLALLSSGVVIFIQFALFLLIGAGLFVFYGMHPAALTALHGANTNRIFPAFIVRQMPVGIAGLLVAAILAAAMSNLSAALNSLSSTTVVDFYMGWRPRANDRERMVVSRASTVLWALVLFAVAIYAVHAGGKGNVVEIGLSIASVAYGCLLGVFLLGTLTRYATQVGAIIGMITGFALNLALWQFPGKVLWRDTLKMSDGTYRPGPMPDIAIPHIAWTWYVLIGALVTFAVGSLASLVFRKRTARRAIATAVLLALSASSPFLLSFRSVAEEPASPATAAPDFSAVSTAINAAIAQKKLPGAVVVIGHGGKVVFEQAYGVRKLAGEPGLDGKPSPAEPMTLDTIFDMASLTKCLVTATAIMQLYEAHKLDFDDPVAKYLPEFAAPATRPPTSSANGATLYQPGAQPQESDRKETKRAEGQTYTASDKAKVTIRELLTHYSGLPPDVDLKDAWGLAAPDKAEGIRRAMNSPLTTTPGTHFEYSDINYIVLGALVEKLSGETLDVYASAHIFLPQGIRGPYRSQFLPLERACGLSSSFPPYSAPSGDRITDQKGVALVECDRPGSWSPEQIISHTAPTQHDDQGTKETNPDFDVLLRGTVHDPTVRRMGGVAGQAGLFSTAADVALFAQALLDRLAGRPSNFPLKRETLQLMTTPQQPKTAQGGATIFTQDGQTTAGVALRGFGWDINSAYSRPRGTVFPTTGTAVPTAGAGVPASFGHTGFTGTSLWMDPASDTYVILLSNAIHPRGNSPISALRGEVATAAAQALGVGVGGYVAYISYSKDGKPTSIVKTDPGWPRTPHEIDCHAPNTICDVAVVGASYSYAPLPSKFPPIPLSALFSGITSNPPPTLTGIDVLEATNFAALKEAAARNGGHLRIGLLTNQTGLDAQGRRTIDVLRGIGGGIELTTLFSPEHGIFGAKDSTEIGQEVDPTTGLKVISLYGAKDADRRPKPEDLKNLDAVVIDLQDAGVRFYTYETVVGYLLEAAACETARAHPLEVILLDRPDPINGDAVQGPISNTASSYLDYMPLPIRHGFTLGELAQYIHGEHPVTCAPNTPPIKNPARLTVVPMQNWRREEFFDATGVPWVNPSPNLRSVTEATLYPALGMMDMTNVSVGRGTATPFEVFGAGATAATKDAPVLPAWFDGKAVAAYLTARNIPGVTFTPTTTRVAEDANHYPYHGQTVEGVRLTVTDRFALDSPELGIEILSALDHLYPTQFKLDKAAPLVANVETMAALERGDDPRTIAAGWAKGLLDFKARCAQYLIYH
jgi:SSS family transporter